MLRQGPIPLFLHGVVEYVAAALFIVAPFVFGFDSGAATAVAIVTGVGVLILTSTTAMSTGIVKSLPIPVHVLVDFIGAAFMIAAPFLFGFSDETAPTAFFIVVGVAHLLVSIATRYARSD
jgi:hypothetical protein